MCSLINEIDFNPTPSQTILWNRIEQSLTLFENADWEGYRFRVGIRLGVVLLRRMEVKVDGIGTGQVKSRPEL